ncbi:P-loop containing nucleoside triphosphate hydrolase protein [Naviculisporaceae sp. PSN 640]
MRLWPSTRFPGTQVEFEGGLSGEYVQKFARKVVTAKGSPSLSLEQKLETRLRDVFQRQTDRLLNQQEETETPLPPNISIMGVDLLGQDTAPEHLGGAIFSSNPWLELQAMVGLDEVKASIQSIVHGIMGNHFREKNGQGPLRLGLSGLFLEPPGTGKTTVAKLYGRILGECGYLSSGELVVTNACEFIGPNIAASEMNTRRIVTKARGKVLMIDETYKLDPYRSNYGHEDGCGSRQRAIDTIVDEIQNAPGEDICVIMCGCKPEMEKMIRRANSGFARHFPLADAFIFKDFTKDELVELLNSQLTKVGCSMTDEARVVAVEVLDSAKEGPNFGNGVEVVNLIGRAMVNYRIRLGKMSPTERSGVVETCFEPEDIDPKYKSILCIDDDIKKAFEQWDGAEHIADQCKSLANRAKALRQAGRNPVRFMPFQMVFYGPPGTGKSSVAKQMGRLYKTLRLLATEEVVKVAVRGLISVQHVDGVVIPNLVEQRDRVTEQMRKALGKVLFIGEAHNGADYNSPETRRSRISETLVEVMNDPEFLGKVLVILAGPKLLVDDDLNSRLPVIAHQFRPCIEFKALTSKRCLELLTSLLHEDGVSMTLKPKEVKTIEGLFLYLRALFE